MLTSAEASPPTTNTFMNQVRLHAVSKSFGNTPAVREVSLDVAAAEFVLLLGPSGSGKTTLLRLIGGYEQPTRGSIEINGRDVTRVPVYQRDIGMVFQNYALFPHMTVAENVGFGLDMRNASGADKAARIDESLDLVRLAGYGQRYPSQLSGGQQQRVALARAIAYRPSLLLLDEPLANLDRRLRDDMRVELKQLQRRIGITTIMVTHDQEESLAMADRIVVLNEGRLEQSGEPHRIYNAPTSPFVASFLGEMNLFNGTVASVQADGAHIRISTLTCVALLHAGMHAGNTVTLGIRAERISLNDASNTSDTPNTFDGVIQFATYQGMSTHYHVALHALQDGPTVKVIEPNTAGDALHRVGDRVRLSWPVAAGVCFGS